MNKKIPLWLTPMLLLLAYCGQANDYLPWEKKLPFKEATIHYESTGPGISSIEKGSSTLYVKEYGKRRAFHTKKEERDFIEETVVIIDQDWISSYNILKKNGVKRTNPIKVMHDEYNKLSAAEKANFDKNYNDLKLLRGNYQASVKEMAMKILGYDCDAVTSIAGARTNTVYFMRDSDLALRSESTGGELMGAANAATKIETGAVSDDVFLPPAGIEAVYDKDADAKITGKIQNLVATLKKPDGAKLLQEAKR